MKRIEDCTVLVVDDVEANIDLLMAALGDEYDISVALSGESALELIEESPPDLILLDIVMPGLDGYEVCQRLKRDPATAEIPVIFLTSMDVVEQKTRAFELGAQDFVTKPFEAREVRARVRTHLSLALAHHNLAFQNERLEQCVRERTAELSRTQDATIHSLVVLAEYRDNETGGHISRTASFIRVLGEQLMDHPRFSHFLNAATLDLLIKSSPLHDCGKVAIRDDILLKPGRLTDSEFAEMKKHTEYGHDAIAAAEELLGADSTFLSMAREIAYCHHEKWDGTGYPRGIAGDDIPIPARLMALADVYDALISRRVYKPPFAQGKVIDIITEGRATAFDPDVVDAFLAATEEFRLIALAHADYEDERALLAAAPQPGPGEDAG